LLIVFALAGDSTITRCRLVEVDDLAMGCLEEKNYSESVKPTQQSAAGLVTFF
jgi:hypothetical protein